jgi:alkylation response protein AidB-like acyl-CoA dehydrogenase
MQLGQGYYKLLDPKYKYSRCYCTDEEIEIAANVARFVDKELMPERHNFEGGWHRDEKLATETRNKYYAECVRMGLTKTSFPKKLGAELGYDTTGLGLSAILRNMVYEELCRAEVGLAMEVMHIHWPVSFMIAAKRDDMLKEFGHQILGDECWMACVAITERAGGANLEDPAFDFRTIRTTLKIEGDDAIVNGVKIWPGTSGPPDRFVDQYLKGHLGYWTIVTRDPSKGSEAAGIVYVPPDAKGFSVSPPYKKILKGDCIGLGRLGVSSRLVGMSEAVLKIALDWTGGRDIAGVPVRERSYFASILAEMAKRIEVARNYMLMCSWQVAHPEEYGTPDSPEMIAKFSAARSFAGNACEFCCNRAMEMMGSYGYSYDYHVEKYMRDYKIIQMVLGGAQRDILDIAQGLYGPFMWSGMDEWIKQGGLVTEGFDGPRY